MEFFNRGSRASASASGGVKLSKSPRIILTADETMMSEYNWGIFVGFATCMPHGIIPDRIFFKFFAPPVSRKDGRATRADAGLRLIESALLESGFSRDEVAVVHPSDLEDVAGDETKIIAIGGHDHLGINPPTSEFADLAQTGPPYNRLKFLELLKKPVMSRVKVVVGGASAWQLANLKVMDRLGIDHVHLGEGEISVPRAFKSIIRGGNVPRIIRGEAPAVEKIPNLRAPTIGNMVEISRGCGRGCSFCSPGMRKFRCKSVDHIVKDVEVNMEAGKGPVCLHSEDALRYMARGIEPRKDKVLELFGRVAKVEGVTAIHPSHIALATAAHNPDLVKDVSETCYSLEDQTCMSTQTGIETGSPRLIEKHLRGKVAPSPPEKWPEIVKQSFGILEDNGWILACTLMCGIPGENRDDVIKTIELVEDLKGSPSLIVPLFFVSMKGTVLDAEKSFTKESATPEHWQLLGKCMEHDAAVIPKLTKNYMRGGKGVSKWGLYIAVKFLLWGVKRYSKRLKRGEPPRDYSKISKNYFTPEVLKES
jgi:radical SAM superfamily enzyme YgiQ (UPF0313 family)